MFSVKVFFKKNAPDICRMLSILKKNCQICDFLERKKKELHKIKTLSGAIRGQRALS